MEERDNTIDEIVKDFKEQEASGDIVNDGVENLLVEKYMLLREKSQAFLKIYPKLVKAGFISIFTVPIIFMILMFTVNTKLVFLTLWIISIIAICGYLIGIEYFYFYYKNLHEEFEKARHPEKYVPDANEESENIEKDESNTESQTDETVESIKEDFEKMDMEEAEDDKFLEGFLAEDTEFKGDTDEEDI